MSRDRRVNKGVKLPVRVILVRPEKPRNVGAAVRAAANFGAESVWVAGALAWDREAEREARVASAGAWDKACAVRLCAALHDAADGCSILVGTSARRRRNVGTPSSPEQLFSRPKLVRHGAIGVVFGPESQGLATTELAQCHAWMRIPVSDTFSSLNLAHAVAVVLYEASRHFEEVEIAHPGDEVVLASLAEQERVIERCGKYLAGGEFDAARRSPGRLAQLRRLLHRAEPSTADLAMLHNILKCLRGSR